MMSGTPLPNDFPPGAAARLIYADADTALAMRTASVDAAAKAAQVESKGVRFGLKAGGAIALAGIAYDIHNGKPVDQAIVSGGVGLVHRWRLGR